MNSSRGVLVIPSSVNHLTVLVYMRVLDVLDLETTHIEAWKS